MTVKIVDYQLPCNDRDLYDVILDDTEIETLVTHDPRWVRNWINNIESVNESRLHRLIVGLDIEWQPNLNSSEARNPVGTLQLRVGKSCLIYQILQSPSIPRRLRRFLQNDDYEFVGVGINSDVKKLRNDYGLDVSNAVDLREWAATELEKESLHRAGLKELVKEVAGKEIEKPKSVTLSCWGQRWLSHNQIVYACLDPIFLFKLGGS